MQDEACFLYVMDGIYTSISETEQLSIKAEEAVLMKCGNYLGQMEASPAIKNYEAIAVHFFPDVLLKVYENNLPTFLKRQPEMPNTRGMHKMESDIIIRKYIESVLFYFEHPELVNEDILIVKLKEIILLLNQTRNAPAIRAILTNLFHPTTYSFREIIKAHLCSFVSIQELAQLTNMSLSKFKREFKRIYQTTPAVYIKEKRLEIAAEHLLLSEDRIGDIAYDCGFKEVAHFSTCFKEKYGQTPSQYRMTLSHK